MSCRRQLLVKLARIAAVRPPRGLPTKREFLRLRTTRFISRSLTECRVPDYAASREATAFSARRADARHLAERHNQSASRKARTGSGARYRPGTRPDGVARASARSLIRISACKYTSVLSVDSWPSHRAITVRSTPRQSRAIAAVWRLCSYRDRRHYISFLTMSSDIGQHLASVEKL